MPLPRRFNTPKYNTKMMFGESDHKNQPKKSKQQDLRPNFSDSILHLLTFNIYVPMKINSFLMVSTVLKTYRICEWFDVDPAKPKVEHAIEKFKISKYPKIDWPYRSVLGTHRRSTRFTFFCVLEDRHLGGAIVNLEPQRIGLSTRDVRRPKPIREAFASASLAASAQSQLTVSADTSISKARSGAK
ncbi:hypothetical protein WG66_012847 [Moniliophthora roreri]|nr:hypothetical protein WG66_012847 [Moniliophthora roreri]